MTYHEAAFLRAKFTYGQELPMQTIDPHPHLTVFFAIWAAVGPLTGILIGHLLTRSWQRKQWLLDNKKGEYRELLAILTRAYGTILRLQAPGRPRDADDERELSEAHLVALSVIRDRLFISRAPTLMRVLKLWQEATHVFESDGDFLAFRESYNNIHATIIGAADRDLGFSKGFSGQK